MAPVIIIVTPGAIVAAAVLSAAVLALRLALTKRPAVPRQHGLREVEWTRPGGAKVSRLRRPSIALACYEPVCTLPSQQTTCQATRQNEPIDTTLTDRNRPGAAGVLPYSGPPPHHRRYPTISLSDTRTEAERRYDMERDGTLYAKPAPGDPLLACLDEEDRNYWKKPIGTIDGCAVIGCYYQHTLFGAEMTWRNLEILADVDHYFNIAIDNTSLGHGGHSEGDITLSEWESLRALAQTDVVEQLYKLVRANATATPPA